MCFYVLRKFYSITYVIEPQPNRYERIGSNCKFIPVMCEFTYVENDLLKLNNILYTELNELKQIFLHIFYHILLKIDAFNIVDIKIIVIFRTQVYRV